MTKTHQRPLIGKHVTVTTATNASLIGITGKVLDETKYTLRVGDKTIIKSHATITIDNTATNGEHINKQPTERIKVQHR